MKVSKQIRKINGEKPDWIMDDIQDIGYWNGMETAAQIAEDLEKETQLTDDQQIVLEWLKKDVEKYRNISNSVGQLTYFAVTQVGKAWGNLSTKQQYQVLAAFAEWEMKEVPQ